MIREPFLVNPPRYTRRPLSSIFGRGIGYRSRVRFSNPVGETLVTVGSNPEGGVDMFNPIKYMGKLSGFAGKNYRYKYIPERKRKRKVKAVHGKKKKGAKKNPPRFLYRRVRRSYRRNPVAIGQVFRDIANIGDWAPLAITGGLSAVTGAVVPGMVGIVNPWGRLGVQLVTAVGGGMLVGNIAGSRHGNAWTIVGVSMVGYQLLKQFVLAPYFPQLAVGLGEYESYYSAEQPYAQVGSGTGYGIDAFPNEVSAFPDEVSAYPYDGSATAY
ncbi:MAG: hypothetical protein QW514_10385 [Thermoprotei archaeon]